MLLFGMVINDVSNGTNPSNFFPLLCLIVSLKVGHFQQYVEEYIVSLVVRLQ